MPRLEDLKKNLLQMTPDEQRAKVREIREDRKLRKEPTKVRKERVRKAASAKDSVASLLAGLSPAEQEALLLELEG